MSRTLQRQNKFNTWYVLLIIESCQHHLYIMHVCVLYMFISAANQIVNTYQSVFCSLLWAPRTTQLQHHSVLWLYAMAKPIWQTYCSYTASLSHRTLVLENRVYNSWANLTTSSLASSQSKGFRIFSGTVNLQEHKHTTKSLNPNELSATSLLINVWFQFLSICGSCLTVQRFLQSCPVA